jgi:hypothetical protein
MRARLRYHIRREAEDGFVLDCAGQQ